MKFALNLAPSLGWEAARNTGRLPMPDRIEAPEDPLDESKPWPVRIYTLGQFEVIRGNQPLRLSRKAERRPRSLLKAIIAFGGQNVSEERLVDALWPEAHGDAARFSLTSAIHRLRRLLEHPGSMIRQEHQIGLNPQLVWVDLWGVERLLERSERYASAANFGAMARSVWTAAALYKGGFLSGESAAPWARPLTDRLRRRLLEQLLQAGKHIEQSERPEDAVTCFERCLSIDPCAEDACRQLMSVYHRLGRPAEVLSVYHRCRDALNRRLGLIPSAQTEALLKEPMPR